MNIDTFEMHIWNFSRIDRIWVSLDIFIHRLIICLEWLWCGLLVNDDIVIELIIWGRLHVFVAFMITIDTSFTCFKYNINYSLVNKSIGAYSCVIFFIWEKYLIEIYFKVGHKKKSKFENDCYLLAPSFDIFIRKISYIF